MSKHTNDKFGLKIFSINTPTNLKYQTKRKMWNEVETPPVGETILCCSMSWEEIWLLRELQMGNPL